jgi:hypothetical protein
MGTSTRIDLIEQMRIKRWNQMQLNKKDSFSNVEAKARSVVLLPC